jgi:hypothetical protein
MWSRALGFPRNIGSTVGVVHGRLTSAWKQAVDRYAFLPHCQRPIALASTRDLPYSEGLMRRTGS